MKKYILPLLLIFSFIIVGCENKNMSYSKIESGKITCDQKDELMKEDNVVLIDVRTAEEYNEGHLDMAINIPYDTITNDIKKYSNITKDTHIIVYCRSGNRSGQATSSLKKAGYENIYDLGAMSNCE